MEIKLGERPIPQLDVVFPDGTKKPLLVTGPVAAKFFGGARRALGFGDRDISEMAEALAQGENLIPDQEGAMAAVDSVLPDDWGLKGQLSLREYGLLFSSLWDIVMDEMGGGGADEKK